MLSTKLTPNEIIAAFAHNPIDKIHGRPTFAKLLHMQDQLAENAQCITSPRSTIGHAALILPLEIYEHYCPHPWQPVNNGIDPGHVVNYPQGVITPQQMEQIKQQHNAWKTEYDIMKNVDIALKNK